MPIQGREDIQVKVESCCRTHFRVEWNVAIQWISLYRLSVARYPGHYDFLNDVAFGHKELWQTLVADSLSVTSQMLWHLATTNYGGI